MSAEPRSARARLIDIREAIEGILSATSTLDFAEYQQNWTVRRAVAVQAALNGLPGPSAP